MADDGSAQGTTWPMPKFVFEVDFGQGCRARFQEVSGLDVGTEEIKYRAGDTPTLSPVKMPGVRKYGNVTLKKGVFANDAAIAALLDEVKRNAARRRTLTIALLDETGGPAMTWTLAKAWPAKILGTAQKSAGGEATVEAMEWGHEGLAIANG